MSSCIIVEPLNGYELCAGARGCYVFRAGPHYNRLTAWSLSYSTTLSKAVLDQQRHVCKMAALVGFLPTDFFTNVVAGEKFMRRGVPKVAVVLNLVALFVVGDIPELLADEGHVSSVPE